VTLPAGQYPGQLTVHVNRIYPTTRERFPRYEPSSPDAVRDLKLCAAPMVTAIDLTITLYRCVPLPTDQGCPPSPEDLAASALQLHADLLAIQRGIQCCFAGTDVSRRNGRRHTIGASTVTGPRGGCVGVEQLVTVSLDDCLVCPVTDA
jgi:hypothetical protein